MSFFAGTKIHSRQGANVSAVFLQRYLEVNKDGSERAIAYDFINLDGEREQRNWAYCMDKTRQRFGNDCGWGEREGVMFWHFVISPDPSDGVDLDTLRNLTMDWAHEWFGDAYGPGKLGSYEVAIVYHDDNEQHIPHAHVVINNTNFENTKRLQIDNKTYKEDLFDSIQDISRSYGLHYFERGTRGQYINQNRYYTKKERQLEREHKYSWKADLCDRIDVSRRTSRSTEQFVEELERLGVGVYEKDDEWVFSLDQNPERWRARGYRLGKDYTKSFIEEYLAQKAQGPTEEDLARIQQNVNRAIVSELVATAEVAAVIDADVTLKEAAETLRTNDEFKITCYEDYAPLIQRELNQYKFFSQRSSAAEYAEEAKRNVQRLVKASEIAKRGDFFRGVEKGTPAASSDAKATRPDDVSPMRPMPQQPASTPSHRMDTPNRSQSL